MARRVFPVTLADVDEAAALAALSARVSDDTLFVATTGALPRLGEDLTVSLRLAPLGRAPSREIVRVDGRAAWAVHEPVGRLVRGFGLALDGDRAPAGVVRAEGFDPAAARPGSRAIVVVDEAALARADAARVAKRAPPSPPTDEAPPPDESRARDVAPARAPDDDASPPSSLAPRDEVTASLPAPDVMPASDETVPLPVVDPFAALSDEERGRARPDGESGPRRHVAPPPTSPRGDTPSAGTDGDSAPRRHPAASVATATSAELPRLVDDDEEDATMLIPSRVRPLPAASGAGDPELFPTLVGAFFVVGAGRARETAHAFERFSWPKTGTKRVAALFPDNDDTIPVGLWTMPSLGASSVSSEEETPDDVSDPRIIVRAADRARALDPLFDLPDERPRPAEPFSQSAQAAATLHALVDDVDDESTDAALDESTADASGEAIAKDIGAPARTDDDATERAAHDVDAHDVGARDAREANDGARDAREADDGARDANETDAAAHDANEVDDGAHVEGAHDVGEADDGAHPERDHLDARRHVTPASTAGKERGAILVSWGAEKPRVLFAADTRAPAHEVIDVPRRHVHFAEIAIYEGTTADAAPRALLGIARLTVDARDTGRTIAVRFALDDDGSVVVTHRGKEVERLKTSWAKTTTARAAEHAPSLVGRLKRFFGASE